MRAALAAMEITEDIGNLRRVRTLKHPPWNRQLFEEWKANWPLAFKPPSEPPVTSREIADAQELLAIEDRMLVAVRESGIAQRLNKVCVFYFLNGAEAEWNFRCPSASPFSTRTAN